MCKSGVPSYQAAVVVNGALKVGSFTPAVGDVMFASVSESTTAGKALLKDITQAKAVLAIAATGATNSYVLDGVDTLINDATGNQLPMPNFQTEHFSACTEDGTTVQAAGGAAVDMQTAAGVRRIWTDALSSTGNGWSEDWKHI
jgi:hypothetical protein